MTPTPNWDHGWMSQLMGQLKLAAWLVMAKCLEQVQHGMLKLQSGNWPPLVSLHLNLNILVKACLITAFSSQSHRQGCKDCKVYNQNIPPNMNVVISSSLLKLKCQTWTQVNWWEFTADQPKHKLKWFTSLNRMICSKCQHLIHPCLLHCSLAVYVSLHRCLAHYLSISTICFSRLISKNHVFFISRW